MSWLPLNSFNLIARHAREDRLLRGSHFVCSSPTLVPSSDFECTEQDGVDLHAEISRCVEASLPLVLKKPKPSWKVLTRLFPFKISSSSLRVGVGTGNTGLHSSDQKRSLASFLLFPMDWNLSTPRTQHRHHRPKLIASFLGCLFAIS